MKKVTATESKARCLKLIDQKPWLKLRGTVKLFDRAILRSRLADRWHVA